MSFLNSSYASGSFLAGDEKATFDAMTSELDRMQDEVQGKSNVTGMQTRPGASADEKALATAYNEGLRRSEQDFGVINPGARRDDGSRPAPAPVQVTRVASAGGGVPSTGYVPAPIAQPRVQTEAEREAAEFAEQTKGFMKRNIEALKVQATIVRPRQAQIAMPEQRKGVNPMLIVAGLAAVGLVFVMARR